MKIFNRRLLTTLISLVLSIAGTIFVLQYRNYMHAAVWHSLHSGNVTFQNYAIKIPRQWWAKEADRTGRISILRASKSATFFEPRIEVIPASLGQVAETEDGQSRKVNAAVSLKNRDPQRGWTYSATNLRATDSTWYCMEDTLTISANRAFTFLTCNAPQVQWTLNYAGPREHEGEAESVFKTFQ